MRPSNALPAVYLCRDIVDFRKGINGLAVLVEEALQHDPFSEQLFVFCNRKRDKMKILYWERNEQLTTENQQYKAEVLTLTEQLNLALARRYAASSEKLSTGQIRLFDEAEAESEVAPAPDVDADVTIVSAHSRKKRGRKPLPSSLPRIDVVHEISESEQFCPHDGNPLTEIGAVTSEQLDIVPAKIQVIRHVRKQYACSCGQCIRTAALPPQPIPKSLASPGLLAHITVSKYQDALPLYRQDAILNCVGVDLPRATLANWMIQAGTLIQPLINLLRDRLLAYDHWRSDVRTGTGCFYVRGCNRAGSGSNSGDYEVPE